MFDIPLKRLRFIFHPLQSGVRNLDSGFLWQECLWEPGHELIKSCAK